MKLRVLRCWKDAVPADTFRLPGDTAPSALPAGGWGTSVARRGEKRDQRASAPKLSGWVRAATPSRVGMPSGRQLAAPAAQRPFPQVSILKEKSPLNLSSGSKRRWCEGGGHRGIIRPSGCSLLETGGPWLGTGVALPLVHSHRSPGATCGKLARRRTLWTPSRSPPGLRPSSHAPPCRPARTGLLTQSEEKERLDGVAKHGDGDVASAPPD